MKRFLIKIALFGIIILLSVFCVFYQADGWSDPFYKRFTSPKQNSLILGSSRVSLGIVPSVINNEIPGTTSYNYAFTYNTSPYGPVYLESIKRKLDTLQKGQLFILGVDPWVLSSDSQNPNDLAGFTESNEFVGALQSVNSKPNFSYLLNHYSEPYIKILYNRSPRVVEDDGFLKMTISLTQEQRLQKRQQNILDYAKKRQDFALSSLRLSYLNKTVNFLETYGDVYLVRLPIDGELLQIENDLAPNFDRVMTNLALEHNISYFDFSKEGQHYNFIDAHHLTLDSAKKLSLKLAAKIKGSAPFNESNIQ
ncbi:hypothetical protein ACU8DI_01850 [Psychroserpens sp. BH13MA-6]